MFQKRRVVYLVAIIFVGMLVAIGVSFKFQILDHDEYVAKAAEIQTRSITLNAVRGEIVDRNGNPIAINRITYRVYCLLSDVENYEAFAKEVAPMAQRDADSIISDFRRAEANGNLTIRLADGLNYEQYELLMNNYRFLQRDVVGTREYPNGKLASQLVGFANDNGGGSGLEYSLNHMLVGEAGQLTAKTDLMGRRLPDSQDIVIPAKNGTDIMLTIDSELQYELEKQLESTYAEYQPIRASGMVVDVVTGEIYAMGSYPSYDLTNPGVVPDNMTDASKEEYIKEDPVETLQGLWNLPQATIRYEPGSIMKVISAAIGLEEDVVGLHEEFYCNGTIEVDGETLKCWKHDYKKKHGDIDFAFGFADSCNIVFIELFDRLTTETIYKYYETFGLTAKTNLPINGEVNSDLKDSEKVYRVEKATYSYGHGNTYTMLQVAQAVASTINGGYLMEPHIIKQTTDTEGNIEVTEPVTVRRVISDETSEQMRYLMERVMIDGSGKKFSIEGVQLGGKSGSSVRYEPETGYDGNGIIASFVEVAPIDNPKYMVFIVVDKPVSEDDVSGSQVAAQPATEMMKKTLTRFDVVKDIVKSDENMITVPQFENLSYEEAIEKLEGLNIPYVITDENFDKETARVVKQFPMPGSKVSLSFKIRLTFGE